MKVQYLVQPLVGGRRESFFRLDKAVEAVERQFAAMLRGAETGERLIIADSPEELFHFQVTTARRGQ